jgi:Universal stress protein family
MYRHILIPTDGSEVAEHAVTNGLALAKSVGAKVTVMIVEDPFDWLSVPETRASQRQSLEALAKHNEQVRSTPRTCSVRRPMQLSRPVCPATRCRWRTRDPIKPLLQQPRTGAAISSSWDRTGAVGCPRSCSAV